MREVRCCVGSVLILGFCASIAAGRFVNPDYFPAERLIENASAYIQEHPGDASGYYTLARVHYLAFVNKAFVVAAYDDSPACPIPYWWGSNYLREMREAEAKRLALEEYGYASTNDVPAANTMAFLTRVYAIQTRLVAENWRPEQPSEEQLVGHAGAAQWNFHRAIAIDPNNALYYLGLASLGEQYLEFFGESSSARMPASLKAIVLNDVRETYLLAYSLSIEEDLQRTCLPIAGLYEIVSHEAGDAYVRLWEAQGTIPTEVQERLAAIKANLATLAALPRGPITPVVFAMETRSCLADLLTPERIVSFDLDGDGAAERRPWVKPTTGLLVWDTDRNGRIISGRQLFGSVTWRLLFSNGYRAMDLLDDNRDGLLSGGEMAKIAVWFDRDSNGRSDQGEVVSLDSLGVTAIATRPTGRDGESPMHSSGIHLKDGRTVPSYDWIAPAVRDK